MAGRVLMFVILDRGGNGGIKSYIKLWWRCMDCLLAGVRWFRFGKEYRQMAGFETVGWLGQVFESWERMDMDTYALNAHEFPFFAYQHILFSAVSFVIWDGFNDSLMRWISYEFP